MDLEGAEFFSELIARAITAGLVTLQVSAETSHQLLNGVLEVSSLNSGPKHIIDRVGWFRHQPHDGGVSVGPTDVSAFD